jgi:hypothetical protein
MDLLLSLLDGLLDRAERAARLLRQGDGAAARAVLVNAGLLLDGLASCAAPGPEVAGEVLRLHGSVEHRLRTGRAEQIEEIIPLLRSVRAGFASLRSQLRALDRQPPRLAPDPTTARRATA